MFLMFAVKITDCSDQTLLRLSRLLAEELRLLSRAVEVGP
jgi:hypothetical protein